MNTTKIVVGYIATAEGQAALDRAVAEAVAAQAELVVVNTGKDGNYAHEQFASAEDLDALSTELTSKGLTFDVRQVTDGRNAAESILGTAAETGADLIVIGMRRRSPVGKLLTGSTAQHVLLDAECAVLSVKP